MRVVLVMLLFVVAAEAQRPAPEVRGTALWAGFIDESFIDHGAFGGSVRYYLTRRLGIEPEVLYMVGPRQDRDLTVIPHLNWDFRPGSDLKPYLIGGVGWLRHWDQIGPNRFSVNSWSWNFGVGVRVPVTPRMFVAPEFRVGIEPTVRVGGSVGFSF
jgi:hypothetical protein